MTSLALALTLLGISLPFDATAGKSTHWRLCGSTREQADVTLAAHEYQGTRGVIRTLILAPYGVTPVRAVAGTWAEAEAQLRERATDAGIFDSIAGMTILGRAA